MEQGFNVRWVVNFAGAGSSVETIPCLLVETLSTPDNLPHVQQAMKEQAFLTLGMLSKSDPVAYDQWLPIPIRRRQRQLEKILAERQERSDQEARVQETEHQPPRDRQQVAVMKECFHYEDILS
ncbi:hypothetical protein BDW75DRAFT_236272 [Aspergillus navahoensis]